MSDGHKTAMWVLRIGVALEFLGHGVLAFSQKPTWYAFFAPFGIEADAAGVILRVVGVVDIALALLLLVRPLRGAVLWMAIWGMWTAMLRPISGMSIVEWVERGANWAAPLALLLLLGLPKKPRDLLGP